MKAAVVTLLGTVWISFLLTNRATESQANLDEPNDTSTACH